MKCVSDSRYRTTVYFTDNLRRKYNSHHVKDVAERIGLIAWCRLLGRVGSGVNHRVQSCRGFDCAINKLGCRLLGRVGSGDNLIGW
jgi:hypothetical protein